MSEQEYAVLTLVLLSTLLLMMLGMIIYLTYTVRVCRKNSSKRIEALEKVHLESLSRRD